MRGTQKRVVFVKNTGSPLFEGAYFVLKSEKNMPKNDKNATRDMVNEANRIIEENFGITKKKGGGRVRFLIFASVLAAIVLSTVAIILILR